MKRLNIDFGVRRRSILYRAGCVLLGVGLSLAVYETWRFSELVQARKGLEAEVTRLRDLIETPVEPLGAASAAIANETSARSTHVIDRLNTPWNPLFEAIESAMSDQVTLLGMDPDLATREVRLQGEAKNVEAMLQFVQRIDTVDVLRRPHLDNYQLHLQDPLRPVRFTLVAQWSIAKPKAEEPPLTP